MPQVFPPAKPSFLSNDSETVAKIRAFRQVRLHSLEDAIDGFSFGGAFVASPSDELIKAMRWLDINVNVNWPLAHYKSAVRYLHKAPEDIAATGGTNWQKYLPPRFQKRIFFPELWNEQELEEWGKGWVLKEVFGLDS